MKIESRILRHSVLAIIRVLLRLVCILPSQHLRHGLLRHLFRMQIGRATALYSGVEFRAPWKIKIGSGCALGGRSSHLDGRGGLTIGNNVNMSSEVMVWTAQHDYRDPGFVTRFAPVLIEDYVWLGPRVIVLPGVTVREGCVAAAGAVITRSTEPYGIYAGVPAKRIGERPRNLTYTLERAAAPLL